MAPFYPEFCNQPGGFRPFTLSVSRIDVLVAIQTTAERRQQLESGDMGSLELFGGKIEIDAIDCHEHPSEIRPKSGPLPKGELT